MVQACKGMCQNLKAPPIPNYLKYQSGYKLCSVCGEFFVIESIRCPCCKTRLRSKARSGRIFSNLQFKTE